MLCPRPGVLLVRLAPLLFALLTGCTRDYPPADERSAPLASAGEHLAASILQRRPAQDFLTHDHAILRKSQLANVRYELSLDLVTGPDE